MSKADWNIAVADMLAEEAATLVFSSKRISDHLSGHHPDWRAWFRRRLYENFLKLQSVGHRDANTPSQLQGTFFPKESGED